MPSIKIKKEDAQELVYMGKGVADWEGLGYKLEFVSSEQIDTSRWSSLHEAIFRDIETGKYYETTYSQGLTECQDESPYEYDGDEIDFVEVEPFEVTVVKYKEVK